MVFSDLTHIAQKKLISINFDSKNRFFSDFLMFVVFLKH